MICVKVHKSYRNVVALCDSDLVGKKFEEGIKQLDLRENFYKEKELDESEAAQLIKFQAKEDSTFNIVGQKSIALAEKLGIISSEGIMKIQNIPFALILL